MNCSCLYLEGKLSSDCVQGKGGTYSTDTACIHLFSIGVMLCLCCFFYNKYLPRDPERNLAVWDPFQFSFALVLNKLLANATRN
jgi:hypothetical protein